MSTAKTVARWLILAAVAIAGGQTYDFDNSANASLKGQYFVREVSLGNLSAQGAIGEAVGVVGIATFDGAGNYSFSGQLTDSASKTGPASVSSSGAYAVAANGFLRIASFAGKGAVCVRRCGERGAVRVHRQRDGELQSGVRSDGWDSHRFRRLQRKSRRAPRMPYISISRRRRWAKPGRPTCRSQPTEPADSEP